MNDKWRASKLETNRLRREAFGIAGVAAIVFLCVVFVLQMFLNASPAVLKPMGIEADGTNGIMILCGVGFTAWGISVSVRCSDKAIRKYLVGTAALLIGWMLVVLLKYSAEDDLFMSVSWYLFYIPIIFAPMLCLFSGLRAASLDTKPAARILKRVIIGVGSGLVLLVLTNNYHHLVFEFSFDNPDWISDYSYGLGYWLVFAWVMIELLTFYLTLFVAAHRLLRRALLPVAIIGLLVLAYALLYALHIEVLFQSNFSLTYALAVVFTMELSLDLGFLPAYAWYGEALRKLPFDLKLFSLDWTNVIATECSKPSSSGALEAIMAADIPENVTIRCKIPDTPDKTYVAYRISGGIVLLSEDLASVNKRREQLEHRRRQLERQNALLEQNKLIRRRLYRQRGERLLLEEVEKSISSTTDKIRGILDNLASGTDEQSAVLRRRQLMTVKLLVAYCKRKGSLVFAGKGNPEFDRERLVLIMNETCADLRSADIECAVLANVDESLPAQSVSVLYDCFYDFAMFAFSCKNPAIMIFIHDRDEKRTELRVALESDDQADLSKQVIARNLAGLLDKRDVVYRLSGSSGQLNLVVVVPKRFDS